MAGAVVTPFAKIKLIKAYVIFDLFSNKAIVRCRGMTIQNIFATHVNAKPCVYLKQSSRAASNISA